LRHVCDELGLRDVERRESNEDGSGVREASTACGHILAHGNTFQFQSSAARV
jgi:hypothetical protein